jgi:hypothetical protein
MSAVAWLASSVCISEGKPVYLLQLIFNQWTQLTTFDSFQSDALIECFQSSQDIVSQKYELEERHLQGNVLFHCELNHMERFCSRVS